MVSFQNQWQKTRAAINEVDLTFLLLRVFSLIGGIAWLLLVPLAAYEKAILIKALIAFSLYSTLCYLVIFLWPQRLRRVYLTSLFLDLIFLSSLVYAETNFESSFFLGFYLLISLHTIYFGLGFGLLVAVFSTICYVISIVPLLAFITWTDLAMRIGFFFLITVPVGLLTEKIKRDKEKVEHFNRTLEIRVAQRTAKISNLLDQECYLREILDTVAHINKLLITTPNTDTLLGKSCARFTQHGHYGYCWIGLLEEGEIRTIHASDLTEPLHLEPPYVLDDADSPFSQTGAAHALRTNETVIRTNHQVTAEPPLWRDPQTVQGFQAVISLPLRPHQTAAPLGVLVIYTWRREGFEPEEKAMLDELAGDIGFAVDSFRQRMAVAQLTAERTANYEETIFSFVDMIEQRDTYTAGHTERVAHYCQLIAKEMGLPLDQIKKLYKAASLHDIGKIATPDSVLLKPGSLTSLDYDLIKLHAFAGYEMLSNNAMYEDLAVTILHHHERYDGTGYPDQLRGDEIPLLSRIISVADAFDAMTTNRIYKGRKTLAQALAELKAFSGSQFHPEVVTAAVKVLAKVEIAPSINQLPLSTLEKKRFAYFFNDRLTGLYNEDYLKIIINNLDTNGYTCLNMLHMQNVPGYNKQHGWDRGNQLLRQFAGELQAYFPTSLVFRAYGNDFAVISKAHLNIDRHHLNAFAAIANNDIEVDIHHIDLSAGTSYTIDKLEKLEILPLDQRHPLQSTVLPRDLAAAP
jgi:HD-GYP domain-containing protein (c-di-GMP phosphodiesterase class II)